jgi:hypothetical protein
VCYAAGNHVYLVAFGYRDDHIGVLPTRPLENIRVRGVPGDHANVYVIFKLAKAIGAGIDDRDIVGFISQCFS